MIVVVILILKLIDHNCWLLKAAKGKIASMQLRLGENVRPVR